MTTITIKRALLERALNALSAPNHCVFSEPPICVDIRAALAAPATAPAPAPAWPTMPPRKGQSHVLFEDGYDEGWAKCLEACKAMFAAPATAPAQPSWHDAPTVPGLWMNGINRHAQEVLQRHVDAGMLAEVNGQWFGPIPIPEDRQ